MKIARRRMHRSYLQLDVTPMADMVFLLLIFFMLSSTFVTQPGINVKLPRSKAREVQTEQQITLTITSANEIFVNKRRVQLDSLERELSIQLAQRTDKAIVIRADTQVSHGFVVEALDAARSAGAERLAIATDRKKNP